MNSKIRESAQNKRVKLWEIAERLGIHDSMLSKKLRHELPQKETDKILAIIDSIAAQREQGGEDNG